ncbi:OsmC family protein [Labrenzia sp. OB1]|uniref:OsmC family protein n=1 Tax=Labrenzia sp. OB1 TaxID=1561204 RepID=UPI0009EE0B8C|nr:OsmC family protein [Labrenzia sp. OB1]
MVQVVDKADFDKPLIRRKVLTAKNAGGLATVVDCGEFGTMTLDEPGAHGGSDLGPSPLQAVLGALCGCEAVTFGRTAREMGFSYEGIEFSAAFSIDIRGRSGMRGVVPHFQSVKVEACVRTRESEARLREVVEETEARCPVFNLIKDANVRTDIVWIRDSSV